MLDVSIIKCLSDNYSYLLKDQTTNTVGIIDPSEFTAVDKEIEKKYKNYKIYYLMGADNLITFHKWHQWKLISSKCNILVFDRTNYKSKSLNSVAFRKLRNEGLKFIKFKKVNISSSKLRKI